MKIGRTCLFSLLAALVGCTNNYYQRYTPPDLARLDLGGLPSLDAAQPSSVDLLPGAAADQSTPVTGTPTTTTFQADGVTGNAGDIEQACAVSDFDYAFFNVPSRGFVADGFGKLAGVLVSLDGSTTSDALCPDGATHSSAQTAINADLTGHTLALTFTLSSTDATLSNDPHATLTFRMGAQSTQVSGALSGGGFLSAAPTSGDVQATLPVTFIGGAPPVQVPLHGVQVTATVDTQTGTLRGQINGAILHSDETGLIQAVIASFSALSPSSQASATRLLDNGNDGSTAASCAPGACTGKTPCQDPDGTCEVAGDGKVGVCEVSCNSSFGPLLAPDVQLGQGVYAPVNNGASPDSLSFGIGFTAHE